MQQRADRMRALLIAALGGLCIPLLVLAQYGGVAAQGQFCATYNDNSPEDCSFTTMEMCQQSVSGVGGACAPQASAPVMPPPPLFQFPQIRPDPYAFTPAPVGPPPPMGPAPATANQPAASAPPPGLPEPARPTDGRAGSHQEATDMHLEDVGFVMRAAAPQQLERLRSLPPRKFVARSIGGRRYYLYADPDLCKCVFLGDEAAVQSYKDLVGQGRLAAGNMSIEDMDPDLSGSIGPGDILDY
jgi:Protein of unknown function (DUF3551)